MVVVVVVVVVVVLVVVGVVVVVVLVILAKKTDIELVTAHRAVLRHALPGPKHQTCGSDAQPRLR